jgi:hypothetical protein
MIQTVSVQQKTRCCSQWFKNGRARGFANLPPCFETESGNIKGSNYNLNADKGVPYAHANTQKLMEFRGILIKFSVTLRRHV